MNSANKEKAKDKGEAYKNIIADIRETAETLQTQLDSQSIADLPAVQISLQQIKDAIAWCDQITINLNTDLAKCTQAAGQPEFLILSREWESIFLVMRTLHERHLEEIQLAQPINPLYQPC